MTALDADARRELAPPLVVRSQAISVQLTVAGFLFAALLLDWSRAGLPLSARTSFSTTLPVAAPCAFGLVGVALASLGRTRRPGLAIGLTSLLAPALGAFVAALLVALAPMRAPLQHVAVHGAVIGVVFVPFIVLIWLRMQSRTSHPEELASHQRASWAIVLLALAVLQIAVALASNSPNAERGGVSAAIGLLASMGLVAICLADRRAIARMRDSLLHETNESVEPETLERARTNMGGNVACAAFAWCSVVAAHVTGSDRYLVFT